MGKTGLWQFESEGGGAFPYILEDASSAFHKINHNKDRLLKRELNLIKDEGPRLTALGGLSPTIKQDHFTRMTCDHKKHTVRITKHSSSNRVLMDVVYDLENGSYSDALHEPAPKYSVDPYISEKKEVPEAAQAPAGNPNGGILFAQVEVSVDDQEQTANSSDDSEGSYADTF